MMESSKCRSGRAFDRVVAMRPSGLGGKRSCALGDEEGVAGEDATDVVLPAGVGAPLEVVQSQLALEVLVSALGTPALLDSSDELLAIQRFGQCRQHVVFDKAAPLDLVDDEPLLLAARVLVADHANAKRRESRTQGSPTPLSPRDLPVAALADDLPDRLDAHRSRL